ncbi:Cycloartenol synthase [Tetrabaena socialis]|uniref:Cycloartenol synthase n=1 Tax=Tetrabaena socialis TaxID=47790 RepID=A0A2J7ZXJ8_9CHLO|nr:Cycloartenol synthase [Tetrabaena socialis]|eukprot:PNH04997.1 Cycloartenol synthase [Tetrabaena socialis]
MDLRRSLMLLVVVLWGLPGRRSAAVTAESSCACAVLSILSGPGNDTAALWLDATTAREAVSAVFSKDPRCGGGYEVRRRAATAFLNADVKTLPRPQDVNGYEDLLHYTRSAVGPSEGGWTEYNVFTADASSVPLGLVRQGAGMDTTLPDSSCILSVSPTGPLHPRTFLLLFYRADALNALHAAGLWASSRPPDDWEGLLSLLQAHAGAVQRQQRRRLQQQGSDATASSEFGAAALPRYGLCLTTSPHCGRAGDVLAAMAASVVQPGGAWQGYAYDLAAAPPAAVPLINSTGWRYAAGLLQSLLAYNAPANATPAIRTPSSRGLPADCYAVSPLFTSGDCMLTMEWDAVVPILAAAPALQEAGVLGVAPLPGSLLVMDRSMSGDSVTDVIGSSGDSTTNGTSRSSGRHQVAGFVPCTLTLCAPSVKHDLLYGLYGTYDKRFSQSTNATSAPQLVDVGWPQRFDPSTNVLSAIARVEAAAVERLLAPGSTPTAATLPSAEQLLGRQPLVNRAPYSALFSVDTDIDYWSIAQDRSRTSIVAGLYSTCVLDVLGWRYTRQSATDTVRVALGMGRRKGAAGAADCDRLVRSPWWLALSPDTGAGEEQQAAQLPVLRQAEQAAVQALEQRGLPAGFAREYLSTVWHAIHAPNAAPDVQSPTQPNWHKWSLSHAAVLLADDGTTAAPSTEASGTRRRLNDLSHDDEAGQAALDAALTLLDKTWRNAARAMKAAGVRSSYEASISAPAWKAPSGASVYGSSRGLDLICWIDLPPHTGISGGAIAAIIMGGQVAFVMLLMVPCAFFMRSYRRGLPRRRTVLGRVLAPRVSPDTTLLVTDVQNSTVLWACVSLVHPRLLMLLLPCPALPRAVVLWEGLSVACMDAALQIHHSTIRKVLSANGGYESATEGDSFVVAFADPTSACTFAAACQLALLEQEWPHELLQHPDGAMVLAEPRAAEGTTVGRDVSADRATVAVLHTFFSRIARASYTKRNSALLGRQSTAGPGLVTASRELRGSPAPSRTISFSASGTAPAAPRQAARVAASDAAGPFACGPSREEDSRDEQRTYSRDLHSIKFAVDRAVTWRDSLAALYPMAWSGPPSTSGQHPSAQHAPSPVPRGKDAGSPPDSRIVVFRGLRVRMGLHSGLTDPKQVLFNKVASSYQYLGEFAENARLVGDTAAGGMIVMSGTTFARMRNSEEQRGDQAAGRGAGDVLMIAYAGHHLLKGSCTPNYTDAAVPLLPYVPSVPLLPSQRGMLSPASRGPLLPIAGSIYEPSKGESEYKGGSEYVQVVIGAAGSVPDAAAGEDAGGSRDAAAAAPLVAAVAKDRSARQPVLHTPQPLYQAVPSVLACRLALCARLRSQGVTQLPSLDAPTGCITVAFLKVVGATTLLADLPGPAAHALDQCQRLVCGLLGAGGGYLVEAGDGLVLAAFGSPAGAADWALDCVEGLKRVDWEPELLAHELCEEVVSFGVPQMLTEERTLRRSSRTGDARMGRKGMRQQATTLYRGLRVKDFFDPVAALRIRHHTHGANATRLVGLDIGSASHSLTVASGRLSYRGKVMNRAARIAGVAAPGQVLCSGTLWDMASTEVQVTGGVLGGILLEPMTAVSLGRMPLKGIKEPVDVMQCLRNDDPVMPRPLWTRMHPRGGATHITSWGKFWLAVLGVYSWDGMNPLTPEMWLLPYSKWSGIGMLHPGRFWCHCRMVYLPMSYVYGKRGTCKETPLTAAIRQELYPQAYSSIDWNAARSQCAKEDLYYPHPLVQDPPFGAAATTETCAAAVLSGLSSLSGLSATINITFARSLVGSVLLDDARCGSTTPLGPAAPPNQTALLWLQHPSWLNGLLARWLRGVSQDASLPTAATRYILDVQALPSPQGVPDYDALVRYTWGAGSGPGAQNCTVFSADTSVLPPASIPEVIEDFQDLPESSCALSDAPTGPLHPRTFLLLFYRADALNTLSAAGLWASSRPPDDWEGLLSLLQAHAGAVQRRQRRRRLQQQGSDATGSSESGAAALPRYGLCLTTSPHCGRAGDVLAAMAASVVQPGGAWQGYAYDLAAAPPAADPLVNSTGWRYAAGLLQSLLAYNAPANATPAVTAPSVNGLPADCHAVSPLFTSGDCMLTMEWDAVVPILAAAPALQEAGVLSVAPLPGSLLVMGRGMAGSASSSNGSSSANSSAGLSPCTLTLCAPSVKHDLLYGLYGTYDGQVGNVTDAPQLVGVSWPGQFDPSTNVLSAIASVEAAAVERLLAPPNSTLAAATLAFVEQVLGRQPLVNRAPYSATYGSITEVNYGGTHELWPGVLQALGDVSAVAALYHAAQLQFLTHRFQRQAATDSLRAPFGLASRRDGSPTAADCDRLVRSPWWFALSPDTDGGEGPQAAQAPALLEAERAAVQALEQRGLPAGFARAYLRAVWHALHAPNAAPDVPSATYPNWQRWSLGHAAALLAAGDGGSVGRRRAAAGGEVGVAAVDGALGLLVRTWADAARAAGPGVVRASYEEAISAPAWSASLPDEDGSRRIQGGALAGLIVGCQVGFVILVLVVWALVAQLNRGRPRPRDVLGRVRAPRVSPDTTLIITDVQNSTVLWEGLSVACMDASLQIHHRTIRQLLAHHGGYESATEGDSFIVALVDPASACAFAAACQLALLEQDWPPELLQHPDCAVVLLDARTADLAAGALGLGTLQDSAATAAERASYTSLLSMPSTAHPTSLGGRVRRSITALMPATFQRATLQPSRSGQREPPRHSFSAGAAIPIVRRTSSPTMVVPSPRPLQPPTPSGNGSSGRGDARAGASVDGAAPAPPAGAIWKLGKALMKRGGSPGSQGSGAPAGALGGGTAEAGGDDSRPGPGTATGSTAMLGAASWRDALLALFVEQPAPLAPWEMKLAPTVRGKSTARLPDGRLVAFRGLRVRMGLHSGLTDPKQVVSFGARGGLMQAPDPLLGQGGSDGRPSGGAAPRHASRLFASPTLRREGTTLSRGLRIKVGLDIGGASHTLTAASGRLSYRGKVMNRAARIAGVAAVGQVLCSGTLWEVACDEVLEAGGMPGGLTSEPLAAVSLGCMALKGIKEPIEIMQCVRDGDPMFQW